jgi:hypothetical protein
MTAAYKYVGVHLTLDGNMEAQIEDLRIKCINMSTVFKHTYFNIRDARQAFSTVFTSSVCYTLPATSIQQKTLLKLQKPVISSVLLRLGFNPRMPRHIVFASNRLGGIGLLDLYSEQGLIHILLESYQLLSDMLGNPLEKLDTHKYVHAPWLQSLRDFLKTINGKIIIHNLRTLKKP